MNRDGFSLVEIIVGMLILVVGVLGLASSTGFIAMQIEAADLRTERTVAYQQVAERLRSADFDNVQSRAPGDAVAVGEFSAWWDVTSLQWALKEISVYTEGPGFESGRINPTKLDTLTMRLARPVQ